MPTVYLKIVKLIEVSIEELENYLYENVEFALQEMKNYDI